MKKNIVLVILILTGYSSIAQNVGINIINPKRAKFEVAGVVGRTSAIFGTDGAGVSIQKDLPSIGFNQYYDGSSTRYIGNGYAAVQYLNTVTGQLAIDMFDYGGADYYNNEAHRAMTILYDGRVNIGSDENPIAMLTVARGTGSGGTAMFKGTINHTMINNGFEENTYIRAGRPGSLLFLNDISNGKVVMGATVGIGTNTPAYPLEIREYSDGKGLCLVNPNTFHVWDFRVSGAEGSMWLWRNQIPVGHFFDDGYYHETSDIRLKKNIEAVPSILDKVMKLRAVTYQFLNNNDAKKRNIGFIAQEVKELFPEVVAVANDTTGSLPYSDMHTVDYASFGVIAIKTIQEQQQQINALQTQIDILSRRLDKIEKKNK